MDKCDTDENVEFSIEEMMKFLASKTKDGDDLNIELILSETGNQYWDVSWRHGVRPYSTFYGYRGKDLKKVIHEIY
ncbi:MAG: hypothetical protein ACLPWD_00750 [Methanobacterium sp.]